MTINSAQVSVSTTPVLLGSGADNGIQITVANPAGPTVYLGGTTVSGTAGYQLPGTSVWGPSIVEIGDALYAVTQSGTATLHVLRGGV